MAASSALIHSTRSVSESHTYVTAPPDIVLSWMLFGFTEGPLAVRTSCTWQSGAAGGRCRVEYGTVMAAQA
eukprot:141682-Chlamydomonas_euryale.AAC.1